MLDTPSARFGLAARIGELRVFAALDPPSRATLGRFQLKVAFAGLLAAFTPGAYMAALSSWFALNALVAAALGVLLRQKLQAGSLTHWDETLWFLFLAHALRFTNRAVS
jgi:hypothetical protein